MSNTKAFKIKNGLDLQAYENTLSSTGIRVFVYNTSKDSDGGAWRNRCQHTSWYNEPLNTNYRGSRRDFPVVAVIKCENGGIVIYDGDDPTLPMWMSIPAYYSHNSLLGYGSSGGIKGIYMLNGTLCACASSATSDSSVNGLNVINFISDSAKQFDEAGLSYWPGTIAERTSTSTNLMWYTAPNDIKGQTISRYMVNVSMRVLPNAKVDEATGLPQPTIVLMTNEGLSVVHDDDLVRSIGYSSYDDMRSGGILDDGSLWFTSDASSNQRWVHVDRTLPTSNSSRGAGYNGDQDDEMYHCVDTSWYAGEKMKLVIGQINGAATGMMNDIVVGDNDQGFDIIHRNPLDPKYGMVAHIQLDYNTGWLPGGAGYYNGYSGYSRGTALATLAGTDDSNHVGTELANPSNNFSNWSERAGNGAGFTIETDGTVSVVNGDGSTAAWLDYNFSTTAGKTYTVDINYTSASGTGLGIYVNYGSGPNGYEWDRKHSFVASGSNTAISLYRYQGHIGSGTLSSVSVREAVPDRTVHDLAPQVYGTVTVEPVATGAELVCYKGFNGSNYLKRPYTSKLDFGTGDFCYSFWHDCTETAPDRILMSHGRYKYPGSGLSILQRNSAGTADEFIFYIGNSGHIIYKVESRGWELWNVVRRQGQVFIYRNGQLEGSFANSSSIDLSAATVKDFYIGAGMETSVFNYGAGRLALFRVSGQAPTEENIMKMYNDEKALFRPYAKCTMAGNHNGVTGLSYDDYTGLLHVGSASAHSVFGGLQLVDSTDDTVNYYVSASNGTVVED
jgi:hypothetical protein